MTEIEQYPPGHQQHWEINNHQNGHGDQNNYQYIINESEEDREAAQNSAKLFERSRIKALAG